MKIVAVQKAETPNFYRYESRRSGVILTFYIPKALAPDPAPPAITLTVEWSAILPPTYHEPSR